MSCADTVVLGKALTLYLQVTLSGAPVDAESLPTYSVYEDEAGSPIATGTMAKLDDSGTTGFYSRRLSITSVLGFELDESYTVRYSAVVGGTDITSIDTFVVVNE